MTTMRQFITLLKDTFSPPKLILPGDGFPGDASEVRENKLPWHDPSLNKSEMELMEDVHDYQSLLIIFLSAIGVGKAQSFPAFFVEDVEN